MKAVRAILFDVDGTLAETERDGHRIAFNRAFQEAGLNWNWTIELYGELLEIAGGKERIQHYIQHYQPSFPADTDLVEFAANLHRAKSQHYQTLLTQGEIRLRPGVRRLIQEAREAGVRLAIATTSALENVLPLLEQALEPGSAEWFEVIAAGDIVAAKKPAPDIYQYALRQMQLDPQDCVAIEDSQQGLRAARGAGLPTIVTCNDYTRNHDFQDATLVVSTLGDVDNPFTVYRGDAQDAQFVDLVLIHAVLEASPARELAVGSVG